MIIYAGIDGTSDLEGTGDAGPYYEAFKNSFVRRLKKTFPDDPFYNRGPYTWGFKTDDIARKAYDHVVDNWRDDSRDAVFLAGYSRGGAAVIEVASWLKNRPNPIPVECLILFDAVDRSTALGGFLSNTAIASTVKRVIYPQRNIWTTGSRISFQNCGFRRENPSMPFAYKQFHTTHGGVGGTPWKEALNPYLPVNVSIPMIWEFGELNPSAMTPHMDKIGSDQVWSWASRLIEKAKSQCTSRLDQSIRSENSLGLGRPTVPSNDNVKNLSGFPPLAVGEQFHLVRTGDSLSKLAIQHYSDMKKWNKIYEHHWNRKEIGSNPDFIKPGMRLVIPARSAVI